VARKVAQYFHFSKLKLTTNVGKKFEYTISLKEYYYVRYEINAVSGLFFVLLSEKILYDKDIHQIGTSAISRAINDKIL